MSECLSHDLSSFFFFQKLVALIVQQTRTLYTVQYSTIYIVGVSVILFYFMVEFGAILLLPLKLFGTVRTTLVQYCKVRWTVYLLKDY